MLKLAIITSFLSQTKDRFHEYNKPLDLDQKFALLSTIEGYSGVEIVHSYEVNDAAETKAALEKYNLSVSAVNVNVKAEPEFRNGGVTALEQEVREKAVQFIKNAKDFAADIGADPGQRNQHAQHDRGNAQHVHEYVERVLMRRRVPRQHIHQFAVSRRHRGIILTSRGLHPGG